MSTPFALVVSALEAKGCRGKGSAWQCPAHEDKRASLSVSEGKDGKALLKCFSGCEAGAIAEALGLKMTELFPPKDDRAKPRKSGGPAPWDRPIRTTFPYRDAEGELLFEQVRFDDAETEGGKCQPRQPDPSARGGWSWKALGSIPRPLYRLPELRDARAAGRTIFVPEGEKDVETLRSLGLAATTNYGGADGWKAPLAEELAGADVVILPDNDPPGEKHAAAILRSLRGKAARVRVLRLPGLPPKGDVTDWVEAGGTLEELEAMAEAQPEEDLEALPAGGKGGKSDAGDGEDSGRDPSCAAQLIAIGRKAELFTDERGDGYGAFQTGSVRRLLKIRSSDFSAELCRQYAESYDYQRAANGEAVASARNVLEALARHQGESHTLNTRFARHEGALWIDLADSSWRAIRVTPGRWEIVDTPPLLFRRYPHMRPLPVPVPGGDLARLFEPFNLGTAEKVLLTAWVVSAPIGDIPRPILLPHGPQGAGKSTLLKMIASILDPSGIDDLDLGGEPRELAQLLDQHALPFFDNVVKVPEASARLLCKAATGGGYEKRRLFTDEESVILTFKRAVMISSINVPTHAPDLLDRCLLLPLDRIPPTRRKLEADLWRDFNAARPAILGGLLDALARAMAVYPTLELSELPRMADFGAWGAAVTAGRGSTVTTDDGRQLRGADAFLYAYRENVGRQTEEVLESDPVARAVRRFAYERRTWSGTVSQLRDELAKVHGAEMSEKGSGWPRQANGLSRHLGVLHATLADVGVTLRWSKEGKSRTRTLTVSVEAAPASSASPDSSFTAQPGLFQPVVQAGPEPSTVRPIARLARPAPGERADGEEDEFRGATGNARKVVNL